MLPITLVVPVGDENVFRDCLLSSRMVEDTGACELIAQRGWRSAAEVYYTNRFRQRPLGSAAGLPYSL